MAKLETNIHDLPGLPGGYRLVLKGPLDSESVTALLQALDGLNAKRARYVAVDVQQLDYVNRTGFVRLVDYSKELQERDGALVLVGLNPKLKGVFDLLGLHSFVPVVDRLAQAVDFFKQGSFQTVAVNLKGSGTADAADTHGGESPDESTEEPLETQHIPQLEKDLNPAEASSEPEPSAEEFSGPDDLGKELADDVSGELSAELEEEPPLATESAVGRLLDQAEHHFPVYVLCADCSANLQVESPGPYRCPRCGNLFHVKADTSYQFVRSSGQRPIRMELVTTKECTRGLIEFVGAVVRPCLPDPNQVAHLQRAVGAICSHVLSAYQNETGRAYQAIIVPGEARCIVEFADSGQTLDTAGLLAELREHVDSAEVKPRLGGGNVYKIVKGTKPSA